MKHLRAVLAVASALLALSLPASSDVKGVVVDRDGKPIPGAKITAQWHSEAGPVTQTLNADRWGKFSFSPPSQYYVLSATTRDYSYALYRPYGQVTELKMVLWPEKKLHGKVVDENGKPIAGASVELERAQAWGESEDARQLFVDNMSAGMGPKAVSEADGSFVLLHLPDPYSLSTFDITLAAHKEGRALVKTRLSKGDLENECVITLPVECTLQGSVKAPNDVKIEDGQLEVYVYLLNSRPVEERRTSVAADGSFSMSQLPPGRVDVQFRSYQSGNNRMGSGPLVAPVLSGVEISPERPLEVEFSPTPGAVVKGTVTEKESGNPIGEAVISVVDDSAPATNSTSVWTDTKGEFSVRVLPGNVRLWLRQFTWDNEVCILEDDTVSIRLNLREGEQKAGVALKASPYQSVIASRAESKPVPSDFELIPGTYKLSWDADLDSTAASYPREAYPRQEVRKHVKRLPKLNSKKPLLRAFQFDGAGALLAVIDESRGTGKGYDVAYIDRNRNGDLTDDGRLTMRWVHQQQAQSEWVKVESRQGKPGGFQISNPISVEITLSNHRPNDPYIFISRKGAWTGAVDSNHGKTDLAVFDTSCNGVYSDLAALSEDGRADYERSDYVFIDVNGIGHLMASLFGPHSFVLNEVILVGRKLYTIRPTDVGSSVTVAHYTGPTGTIAVDAGQQTSAKANVTALYLSGTPGFYSVKDCSSPIPLPAAHYKIVACELDLETKDAHHLVLSCESDVSIEVKPDAESRFGISGDVTAAIDPKKKTIALKPGAYEPLDLVIKIGENMRIRQIRGRDVEAESPKVEFFDLKGNLLATTTAGYT